MCSMESARLKIKEHMTSVGEEILCVLDKQQRGDDDCCVELNVRVFVLERLSAVAEFMCNLFQREIETLHNTKLHTADVSSMTVQHMVVEPQKRGRGRPRKYPVCLPSPAVQCVVIQPKKCKPGRPRKHQCGGPVPSPLPEEERAGRDEEREDEMAGEDEERTGRRYDYDPTWHPDRHRERSRVSGEMASKRYSALPEEQREMDQGHGLLDARLKPAVKLGSIDFLHLHKEEVRIQEESDPPLSKEEQEELLQRPEEADDGSIMTLLEEESGDDENRETEPVASTSTEHMKTQADAEDCGTSQPTADDQLSSHCSESDTEAIDEDWEESTEGHLALNTLKSQKTQNVKGQRLSLSKKPSQDPKSSKQSHSMRSHPGKKSYICEVCGKCCSQKCNLQMHMRSHTGEKPFSCMVCGKKFAQQAGLQYHMRVTEHMKTQAVAEDCGTSQRTADDQLSSHSSESDTEAIDEDWEETTEGHLALNTLKSQKTQNVKGQRLSLSKKLSQDPKSSKQSHSMRSHPGKKSFTCEVCGKCCSQKCNLQMHMRSHTGEKPFSCMVCGKEYAQQAGLQYHMRVHTGEKPFTCEVCCKGFSLKTNLQVHMRSHSGEKPYTCTVCCKGFSLKANLQLHMRMHTGDKPFTCTVCGKSCNHASHLKTHMAIHTEKRPYMCEVCGKGFKFTGGLKLHMKTHTGEKPFSCTVCGRYFSRTCYLKLHIRTHTGEKPYNCTVCGNGFRQKCTLQIHMRVHTGEKPFSCTICAKQFGQKCNLQRHMRRKHTGGKRLLANDVF